MTRDGPSPRLERTSSGGAIVRAYTDLKRHNLNDDRYRHFANERLPQGKLNGFAQEDEFTIPCPPRPLEEFLTRKLWDVGNTMPYGHRGDLTTIEEAIHFHGGEARSSRDAFFTLPEADQDAVLEFLLTLQILPDGSPRVVKTGNGTRR
jgi:cytochrome c peroxidase